MDKVIADWKEGWARAFIVKAQEILELFIKMRKAVNDFEGIDDVIIDAERLTFYCTTIDQLTLIRKKLREYFGDWKDRITDINSFANFENDPTEEELQKENPNVYIHYKYNFDVDKEGKVDDDKLFTDRAYIHILLAVKYSDVPVGIIHDGCSFKKSKTSYLTLSCKIQEVLYGTE